MRYLSLFSGIEAATVAWHPLGWECAAVAEIEPFPCAVLAHHYPTVPNLGDVSKITEDRIKALGRIDLVVFGSPCQDLSIAGKRKGFDGSRSSLFFEAIRIVRHARQYCGCRFALWENVYGAFSSNEGRDFAAVVAQMAGLGRVDVPENGWGAEGAALGDDGLLEWSVLDAQWFGVAQRRRRVFAIADFGDWTDRPPILLEPHSLRGNSPPSRETGKGITHDVAPCLTSGGRGVERTGETRGQDPVIAVEAFGGNDTRGPIEVATARNACASASVRMDFESETFLVQPVAFAFQSNQSFDSGNNVDLSPTLRIGSNGQGQPPAIAFSCKDHGGDAGAISPTLRSMGHDGSHANAGGQVAVAVRDVAQTVTSNYGKQCDNSDTALGPNVAIHAMQVRRLTTRECERLQGFPDDYTLIPVKKVKRERLLSPKKNSDDVARYVEIDGEVWQMSADGPRYKSLGNSMATTVMRWIGRRIKAALV